MNKFKGFLLCTDCDGTLTDTEGNLSDKNARAIRYFQDEGGLFTLATGRFPEHVNKFEGQFDINAPIVSLNGTILYDVHKDKIINTWTMKKADCIQLLEYVHRTWGKVWEYWINYSSHESVGYKPMDHKYGDNSLRELMQEMPEELSKMVLVQPEEITPLIQRDLKEKFGDKFRLDTSWKNGLEVQNIDSGKGIAVRYMKEHMNDHIKTTVGVGDYENDISLLQFSDIGYAVDNALDIVKKTADRITVSNNESAIAAVINDLEHEMA